MFNKVIESIRGLCCPKPLAFTDLRITKTFIDYDGRFVINVWNDGPLDAENVKVFDLLPPGLVVNDITTGEAGGASWGGVPTLAEVVSGANIASLPVDSAVLLHLWCDMSTAIYPLTNSAFVLPPPNLVDNNMLNNYAAVMLNTPPCCNTASISVDPGSVGPGDTVTVTLSIHNCGSVPITGITATALCDVPGVSFVTPAEQSVSDIPPGDTLDVVWELINDVEGPLNGYGSIGASFVGTCVGEVTGGATSQMIEFQAAPPVVSPVGGPPECCVSFDAIIVGTGEIIGPGETYAVIVDIFNCGAGPFDPFSSLSLTVPAGQEISEDTPGGVTGIGGTVVGGPFSFEFVVTNTLETPVSGEVSVTATIPCGEEDAVIETQTAPYPTGETMGLNVTGSYDGSPEGGDAEIETEIQMLFTIGNTGPYDAQGVQTNGVIPAAFNVASIEVSYTGMPSGPAVLTQAEFEGPFDWPDAIPPSGNINIVLTGEFDTVGMYPVTLGAEATSDPVDSNTANNVASLVINV